MVGLEGDVTRNERRDLESRTGTSAEEALSYGKSGPIF